jgi:hypothetical protein
MVSLFNKLFKKKEKLPPLINAEPCNIKEWTYCFDHEWCGGQIHSLNCPKLCLSCKKNGIRCEYCEEYMSHRQHPYVKFSRQPKPFPWYFDLQLKIINYFCQDKT